MCFVKRTIKSLAWRRQIPDSSKKWISPGSFLMFVVGMMYPIVCCMVYSQMDPTFMQSLRFPVALPVGFMVQGQYPSNVNYPAANTSEVQTRTLIHGVTLHHEGILEVFTRPPSKLKYTTKSTGPSMIISNFGTPTHGLPKKLKRDVSDDPKSPATPTEPPKTKSKTRTHTESSQYQLKSTAKSSDPPRAIKESIPKPFRDAILGHMDRNRVIVLSSGDMGYLDMAVNLFKTSYEKFNVKNHLFVGSDRQFCEAIKSFGANCVTHITSIIPPGPSYFNSKGFMVKSYLKVRAVMDALALNVTVLFVDLDVVFLKNPLPDVLWKCPDCDLTIQSEGFPDNLNTGFYMVRPTRPVRVMLQRAWAKMNFTHPSSHNDQRTINIVLIPMRKNNEIKQFTLSMEEYPFGVPFFDEGRRIFKGDNPCSKCMIVHNNGILGVAAKRYRFKEYGLWQVDEDGYYSDPERKYISYGNPTIFQNAQVMSKKEFLAFKTALVIGHLLNRTVIVPQFHTKHNLTALSACVDINRLDTALPLAYREHIFLQHPLVPAKTKTGLSQVYLLHSKTSSAQVTVGANVQVLQFPGTSVAPAKILQWFSYTKAQVLRFHSLFLDVAPDVSVQNFTIILQNALRRR